MNTALVALMAGIFGAVLAAIVLLVSGRIHIDIRKYQSTIKPTQLPIGRMVVGLCLGALMFAITSWVTLALLMVSAPFVWESIMHSDRQAKAEMNRLEAIIEWIESVRDQLAAGSNIETAIMGTLATAPRLIHMEVTQLAADIRGSYSTSSALRRMSTSLDSRAADQMLAPLIMVTETPGSSLVETLNSLSAQGREELAMMKQIEAKRAPAYTNVRMMVLVSFIFLVGVGVIPGGYMQAYKSFTGQIVMGGGLLVYGLAVYIMTRLIKPEKQPRFITTQEQPASLSGGQELRDGFINLG